MKKNKKLTIKETYRNDATALVKAASDKKNKEIKMLRSHTDMSLSKQAWKKDGWQNIISGLGTGVDKSSFTNFVASFELSDSLLADMWVGDGLAQRIVSVVPADMLKNWFYIENDTDNAIMNKIESLSFEKPLAEALNWKRLFGGSIIVIGIDDGKELSEEVDINRINSVDWVRTFDRTQIALTNINFFTELSDKNYGELEFYTVFPIFGQPFNVHRSRVLEFKGIPVPARVATTNYWFWGMSVLQPIWDQVKDMAAAYKNTGSLLYEMKIAIYKVAGLAQKIAAKQEKQVIDRFSLINKFKSMFNAVLLDASHSEDFKRDSLNLGGIPEILDRYMYWLSAVSSIPVTKLFGRAPGGLNATGIVDLINYYDTVATEQRTDLKPQLMKLVSYINASKEIKKTVQVPVVVFNKLQQLTEKEEAEIKKVNADTDHIYLLDDVVSNEEVREARFVNGYTKELSLDSDTRNDTPIYKKVKKMFDRAQKK